MVRVSSSESNWATLVECECSHHCPNLAHTTVPTLLLPMLHPCSHHWAKLALTIAPTFFSSLGQLCSHHCTHYCANLAVPLCQPCFPHCAILTLTDTNTTLAFIIAPTLLSAGINLIMSINLKQNKNEQIKRKTKNHMKSNNKKYEISSFRMFLYKHQQEGFIKMNNCTCGTHAFKNFSLLCSVSNIFN